MIYNFVVLFPPYIKQVGRQCVFIAIHYGFKYIIIMVCLSGLPDSSTFGGATRCLGLLIVCGYCFGLIVPWFGLFLPLLV